MDDLIHNNVLIVSVLAWFLAQFSKAIVLVLREHRFQLRTMMSAGGMPSSHSALVTALTTRVGMEHGTGTTIFALSAVFAGVVLYDAAGVRRAVSMQARTLNRMIEELFEEQRFSERRLLELLGHTPFEVFVGALLGIVTALTYT
ncbi:MAG: divergent PAP2 family protein [Chloroflexota bacterium]